MAEPLEDAELGKYSAAMEFVGSHLDFIIIIFPLAALLFESLLDTAFLINLGALGEHLQVIQLGQRNRNNKEKPRHNNELEISYLAYRSKYAPFVKTRSNSTAVT